MNEGFLVSVYKQKDNLDDAWYLNDEINSIACCLLGIPGIEGRISFSDHVTRSNLGLVDRTLHFTIAFKGHNGQIGSNFLYSSLEESTNWKIDGSSSMDYSQFNNLTIIGSDPLKEIIRCINREIQNPKWEQYWDKFDLNFTGDFIDVKQLDIE